MLRSSLSLSAVAFLPLAFTLSLAGCGSSNDATAATPAPGGTGGAAGAGGGSAAGTSAVGGAGGTAGAAGMAGATSSLGGSGGSGGAGGGDTGGAGGDSGGSGGTDAGGAGGAGGDMGGGGFVTAPHPNPPKLFDSGGPKLKDPQIVTITFPGYPYKSQVEALGDFFPGSSWMKTWTSEYGVGTGAHVAKVVLPMPPSPMIDDKTIGAWLVDLIKAGTVPAPPDPKVNDYIYMIYYPVGVKITGTTGSSCVEYDGYHTSTALDSQDIKVAYAVNMTCPGSSVYFTASHELNEAVLDPQPQNAPALSFVNSYSPWTIMGSESSDACENLGVSEGGWTLTRVWSNANASSGDDPCIPKPKNDVFYGVTATPAITQFVKPGKTLTYTLQAWSESPIANWKLQAFNYNGPYNPKLTLSQTSVNNGDTVTLTFTIPANAKSGDFGTVLVYSNRSQNDYHFWPVAWAIN